MAIKNISVKLLSRLVLLSAIVLIFCRGSGNTTEKKGQKQSLLQYSYSGSQELGREFKKTMAHPEVQQLLLEMAESPRSAEYIEDALNEIDISLSDLLNLQLVRQDENRLELSFVLYTTRY